MEISEQKIMPMKDELTPEEINRLRVLISKAVECTLIQDFSTAHSGDEYAAHLEHKRCIGLAVNNLPNSGIVKTTYEHHPDGQYMDLGRSRSTVTFMETDALHEIQRLIGLRIDMTETYFISDKK